MLVQISAMKVTTLDFNIPMLRHRESRVTNENLGRHEWHLVLTPQIMAENSQQSILGFFLTPTDPEYILRNVYFLCIFVLNYKFLSTFSSSSSSLSVTLTCWTPEGADVGAVKTFSKAPMSNGGMGFKYSSPLWPWLL